MIKRGDPLRIISNEFVRRDRGPVVGLEVVAERFRTSEVRDAQIPGLGAYLLDAITEELAYVIFRSPQWRRLCSGRRRCRVRLHGREHLANEARGRPGDQADG